MNRMPTARRCALAGGLSLCLALSWSFAETPQEDAGRRLYEEKCGMCHAAGGMGTGLLARRYPPGQELLEQRSNLTPTFIEVAVRSGIGNMPRISRAEVSDEQLALISRYLSRQATP